MEWLLALLLIWIVVTLTGHASFLLVRGVFRILSCEPSIETTGQAETNVAVTRRVVSELADRELLTRVEVTRVHTALDTWAGGMASVPEPDAHSLDPVDQHIDSLLDRTLDPSTEAVDEILVAEVIPNDDFPPSIDERTEPTTSNAEIIRSFLAANNIRWGELAAGLLIVVCSIGLVISLWNTITAHRFVPSMIFLGANAAIYAAGFYTLGRWRLTHTSRAVLVIATLLVPLTVLAGIAAAAGGVRAVELTDPFTMLVLVIASTGYGVLLYRGAVALGRRWFAMPMTLAVAGPVAILPLIPATVRNFEHNAGAIVAVGSITVYIALAMLIWRHPRSTKLIGGVSARIRMLVIGLAAFSMAVAVGYSAFALQRFGNQALMTIAIATLPALVALAAASRCLATGARSGAQAMTGAILSVLALGSTTVMIVPAMTTPTWLWSWAIVLSLCMAVTTFSFQQPRWLVWATLPIGGVAIVTASDWMAERTWMGLSGWSEVITGEAMLASLLVGFVVTGLAIFLRFMKVETTDRWMIYSAAGWIGVAAIIAAILSATADTWLGIVPRWGVTAVLSGATVLAAIGSRRLSLASPLTTVISIFASASVFRPFIWDDGLTIATPLVWIHTMLGVAVIAVVLNELLARTGVNDSDGTWTAAIHQRIAIAITSAAALIGAAWCYGNLLTAALGTSEPGFSGWELSQWNASWLSYDLSRTAPLVAQATIALIMIWDRRWRRMPTFGLCTWSIGHIAMLLPWQAVTQLVLAASTTSIAYGLACLRISTDSSIDSTVTCKSKASDWIGLLIVPASLVLIAIGWFYQVTDGQLADRFSTLSVSAWWLVASVILLVRGKFQLDTQSTLVSAWLAPASAALAVSVFTVSNPLHWCQVAAIVAMLWLGVTYLLASHAEAKSANPALEISRAFVLTVGVGSAVLATGHYVLDVALLQSTLGIASATISLIAVGYLGLCGCHIHRHSGTKIKFPWMTAIALLAGQIAAISESSGLATRLQAVELLAIIWLATSIAALMWHDRWRGATWHISIVSLLLLVVDGYGGIDSDIVPALALAGLAVAGCLVGFSGGLKDRSIDGRNLTATVGFRALGGFVILSGYYLLTERIELPRRDGVFWTTCVVWTSCWVATWRWLTSDRPLDQPGGSSLVRFGSTPDTEFAILVTLAAVIEVMLTTITGFELFPRGLADPLVIARVIAWIVVAVSVAQRSGNQAAWNCSIALTLSLVSFVAAHLAVVFDASPGERCAASFLAAGLTIALISHWIYPISQLLSDHRLTGAAQPTKHRIGRCLAQATWQSALVVAAMTAVAVALMIMDEIAPAEINLTIVTIALCGWAIAVAADTTSRNRLRHVAASVALVAIGLWASVVPVETAQPMLIGWMRWLVAAVFVIPMVLFVIPAMIGQHLAGRWRGALQRAGTHAGIVAGIALIGMLIQESLVRSAGGIAELSQPMVIGVAVVLAILSGLVAAIAILSGPKSAFRERIQLSDIERVWSIYAAQGIGVITWLHVFLCNTDWAFVGLRAYWPYIVMALAFASVGAVEWARRRDDPLLANTLKTTALYLPLVPVIGFWFRISAVDLDWLFDQGKVRYDILLTIGAGYYFLISAIWKGVMQRVATVVLANAAWWIVLVQQPGWQFLAHPQVWLIPPAVCVLFLVHRYRERLDRTLAAAIRYGATLTIYVSSTADMLLQQIGQNLWGPMILILLALAGMALGVVLRVRPFLFLGAGFVLVGVTSMVWHAQQAIGQVWPWWVFGITTGIGLLVGLMALEKNKPKLRRYADQLSSWQA